MHIVTTSNAANLEPHYAIKFCANSIKSVGDTEGILKQAYAAEILSQAQVYKWHKALEDDQKTLADEHRQSTSRT